MKTVIKGFEKYIQEQTDDKYFEDQTLYKFKTIGVQVLYIIKVAMDMNKDWLS